MTIETIPPLWMRDLVSAADYDSWPEARCNGIEIMDAMVVVRPRPSKRHN
jgi:hypothetical protein